MWDNGSGSEILLSRTIYGEALASPQSASGQREDRDDEDEVGLAAHG
ncbi:MAG: hypothetical protein HC888_10730 [Candidatus Competibacteraceae bacterium]|nr:hypothetical protein [Candidatus Competibacteraceae bacterium]